MFPPWVCWHCGRIAVAAALAAVAAGCGGDKSPSTATPQATATSAPRSPAATAPDRVARSRDAVLRWLAGRRVRIDGRSVRIDPATLTCAGVGRASRRHGGRAWTRFRCVQPTLPAGSVAGPDAILLVESTGRRAFAIVGGSFTEY